MRSETRRTASPTFIENTILFLSSMLNLHTSKIHPFIEILPSSFSGGWRPIFISMLPFFPFILHRRYRTCTLFLSFEFPVASKFEEKKKKQKIVWRSTIILTIYLLLIIDASRKWKKNVLSQALYDRIIFLKKNIIRQ